MSDRIARTIYFSSFRDGMMIEMEFTAMWKILDRNVQVRDTMQTSFLATEIMKDRLFNN
jgi:hypothetical protein